MLVTSLILVCVSFLVFVVYNAVAIGLFGVPWSMSKTYYLYENKKRGLGWLFTIFMWVMALTMLPGWINISNAVGPWMNNFTFLSFITCGSLLFVGVASQYKEFFVEQVHTISALVGGVAALLWIFLVCWNIWWIPLVGMVIPVIIATLTKTWKTGRDFWLEMMIFDATFITVIVEALVQLGVV